MIAVRGLGIAGFLSSEKLVTQSNWLQGALLDDLSIPVGIKTYGHDSSPVISPDSNSMTATHANEMLQGIVRWRKNCQDRPLIFIGHCIGGVVIGKVSTRFLP